MFKVDTPFDRRNAYLDHATGLFDADYNDKVAITAIKTTLSGSYLWIDGFMDQISVITSDYFDTILGSPRPLLPCTEANICDNRGCHNGRCHIKYFEVNPGLCADTTPLSLTTESACDVQDGLGAKNWFNLASLPRPKKHRGFGRPWSPNLKLTHWSLVEGLPNGDTVTVEDIMYQDSLSHGNKCDKETICESCTWKDIVYSSRVDIWEGITVETFISELLSHNPNFYATVVTINFDIEATIGYCRNENANGRRLLSTYHLSHAQTHDNVIRKQASVGIRLGSEADEEDPIQDSTGTSVLPSPSHHHHNSGDLVSLTVSGGTNVLVLGMSILFLMSLCFLYALCQKAKKGKGFIHQDRSVVRTWR